MRSFFGLVVIVWTSCADAQDFKFMPWKYDRWLSTDGTVLRYDKLEHAVRDGAIFCLLSRTGVNAWGCFAMTVAGATVWEVWDGFRWRETDGFSCKDLLAGAVGALVAFYVLGRKG